MTIPLCVYCDGVYSTEDGKFTDRGPRRRGAWIHKKCLKELATDGEVSDQRQER